MGDQLKDMNLRVNVSALTPATIWRQKDERWKMETASLERWNKMTDEERTAILEIVGNMLERLIDRLPEWVPRALDVKEGQKLDIQFSVLFSTLEEQMAATKEVTNRRIREAAEGTAALVKELSGDD